MVGVEGVSHFTKDQGYSLKSGPPSPRKVNHHGYHQGSYFHKTTNQPPAVTTDNIMSLNTIFKIEAVTCRKIVLYKMQSLVFLTCELLL